MASKKKYRYTVELFAVSDWVLDMSLRDIDVPGDLNKKNAYKLAAMRKEEGYQVRIIPWQGKERGESIAIS